MAAPLTGIRVLDLALLLPGALAATWLADLGASVTRIEPPWGADGFLGGALGPYFSVMRGGKELLRMNLRESETSRYVMELIEQADILIEGFRPGALARRGLGYEAVRQVNPRLIYCSISGFGQDGPRRDQPAHDNNYLALTGVLSQVRGSDGQPHLLPFQLADVGGGTYPALVAILTALFVRERTGEGQHLDVALFDGALAWNYFSIPVARYPDLDGMGLGLGLLGGEALCYNIYECADGGYLALGALEPHFWRNVCTLLDRPDLIPLGPNPQPGAKQRLAEFRALFRTRPRAEWLDLLNTRETLATPLLSVDEVLADEYVQSRGLLVDEQGVSRVRFPVSVQGNPD